MTYKAIILVALSPLIILSMEETLTPSSLCNLYHAKLFKAAHNKNHAKMNLLLSTKTCPPNSINYRGAHILLYTITHSSTQCLEVLLNHKPDLTVIDERNGDTALHKAYNNKEKMELLWNSGADINKKNSLFFTPLTYCVANQADISIIKYLLEKKETDIDAVDFTGQTALHKSFYYLNIKAMFLLLKKKACVDIFDYAGKTVLHYAAEHADLNAIQLLLKYGANAHQKTACEKKLTPLQLALGANEAEYSLKNKVVTLFTLLTIPAELQNDYLGS